MRRRYLAPPSFLTQRPNRSPQNLVLACRQIHYEALPLLYELCTFNFDQHSLDNGNTWKLNRKALKGIQTIRISAQEVWNWCEAYSYGVEYSKGLTRMEALKQVCVERHRGLRDVGMVVEIVRMVFGDEELEVVVDGLPAW
jgi:hypothetical protein